MADGLLDLESTDGRESLLQLKGLCLANARYSSANSRLLRGSLECGSVVWDLDRSGDMVSAVYLEIRHEDSVDPISLIDFVALTLNGAILDSIDSPWLKVQASFDKDTRPVKLQGRTVQRIKFGAFGPEGLFPLLRLSKDARLQIVCRTKAEVDLDVFATYHIFDQETRRTFPSKHALPVWNHMGVQHNVESTGAWKEIRLHDFDGPVRELIVLVQPEACTEACTEPVEGLELYLDKYRRTCSSPSWHRHVDAHKYGMDENPDPVYFIPFDDTPLASQPACTLNLSRFFDKSLRLRLARGKFKVTICARMFNVMCVSEEYSGLKWQCRGTRDSYPGFPAVK